MKNDNFTAKFNTMMKKIVNLLAALSLSIGAFAQEATTEKVEVINVVENQPETIKVDTAAEEKGALINGVIWATRNLDEPGTFARSEKDAGMFYQWNRPDGWCGTDPLVNQNDNIDWDNTIPLGITWERNNDPSPKGWRIPTFREIDKLLDTDHVSRIWVVENGIAGMRFTDKENGNTIFFPAGGFRETADGALDGVGLGGYYWSITQNDSSTSYSLYFYTLSAGRFANGSGYGLSIRPVSETVIEVPEEELPQE